MAERPILFSAPMVRANRAGLKWQTRRLMKPAKCKDTGAMLAPCEIAGEVNGGDYRLAPCAPGDVLWVREAWRTGTNFDKWSGKKIQEEAMESGYYRKGSLNACCPIWYEADGAYRQWGDDDISDFGKKGRYRHARFMPRWACRDTYTVLSVRAERLQEITEADADAEGADSPEVARIIQVAWSKRDAFAKLWEHINGPGSWDANPWVWVIEYNNPARKLVDAQEGK